MKDIIEIIRRRIENGKPDEHAIPNCDVRLLILEIDRLNGELDGIAESAETFGDPI